MEFFTGVFNAIWMSVAVVAVVAGVVALLL